MCQLYRILHLESIIFIRSPLNIACESAWAKIIVNGFVQYILVIYIFPIPFSTYSIFERIKFYLQNNNLAFCSQISSSEEMQYEDAFSMHRMEYRDMCDVHYILGIIPLLKALVTGVSNHMLPEIVWFSVLVVMTAISLANIGSFRPWQQIHWL